MEFPILTTAAVHVLFPEDSWMWQDAIFSRGHFVLECVLTQPVQLA
jgi:hypothetical protein